MIYLLTILDDSNIYKNDTEFIKHINEIDKELGKTASKSTLYFDENEYVFNSKTKEFVKANEYVKRLKNEWEFIDLQYADIRRRFD